jgi:7-keto-8-aminopelargonate synthetase-like enzyme
VVVEAARKALDTHGYGLSSVRFICGTQDLHKQLEARISAFHGTEDTILYPSCFDANAGAEGGGALAAAAYITELHRQRLQTTVSYGGCKNQLVLLGAQK